MIARRALLIAVGVLVVGLAGCIGTTEDGAGPSNASGAEVTEPQPGESYVPVKKQALSEPKYDVSGKITDRISVSTDDVDLYIEYWLPRDEDGPVPTVLHSTPYRHLSKAINMTAPYVPSVSYEHPKEFWVSRGYAYAIAHVRGFGESEGCVEVWGPNEQADQADLVNWVANQSWSDGTVGMTGGSYPGTTPMEAAVQAPEPLKAIVPFAGLTNPYYDWHFGGVPNGESVGSTTVYQGLGAVLPQDVTHGTDWAESSAHSGCEAPTFLADAYQPDGTYTEFYETRNLSARVDNVEAAVLYAQGFDDPNVKPSQILGWFNELDTQKKGIFGHWGHDPPPRDDWVNLTLAWFDEHLKGRDTGVTEGPTVEVLTDLDTWRSDEAFPSNRTHQEEVYLHEPDTMAFEPGERGSIELDVDRAEATAELFARPATGTEEVVLETEPLEEDLYVSGVPRLSLNVTLENGENAFLSAELYRAGDNSSTEITYGMQNLALRNNVREYEAVPTGEPVDANLRFQPVESILEAGTSLRLLIEPVDAFGSPTPEGMAPGGILTLHVGGEDATRLQIPTLDGRPDVERPDDV